jgi:hypothetical protein
MRSVLAKVGSTPAQDPAYRPARPPQIALTGDEAVFRVKSLTHGHHQAPARASQTLRKCKSARDGMADTLA